MSFSSGNWDSPSVLPLGMRLTELKSRSFGDSANFQTPNESDVDYLDLSDALSRFSAKPARSDKHNCENEAPLTEPNPSTKILNKQLNPRVARIKDFIKKYNIDLTKKPKRKTPVYKCAWPTTKNLRTCRNKVLHYYNLLRGPKNEEVEHPDVVKFRRCYKYDGCSTLPLKKNDFNFQPNFHCESPVEQMDLFDSNTQLSVDEKCEYVSHYFTPLTSSGNLRSSESVVSKPSTKRVRFMGDVRTIEDLIRFNNSVSNKSMSAMEPALNYLKHSPHSPEVSPIAADAGNSDLICSNTDFQHGMDSQCTFDRRLPDILEDNFAAGSEVASVSGSYPITDIGVPKTESPRLTDSYSTLCLEPRTGASSDDRYTILDTYVDAAAYARSNSLRSEHVQHTFYQHTSSCTETDFKMSDIPSEHSAFSDYLNEANTSPSRPTDSQPHVGQFIPSLPDHNFIRENSVSASSYRSLSEYDNDDTNSTNMISSPYPMDSQNSFCQYSLKPEDDLTTAYNSLHVGKGDTNRVNKVSPLITDSQWALHQHSSKLPEENIQTGKWTRDISPRIECPPIDGGYKHGHKYNEEVTHVSSKSTNGACVSNDGLKMYSNPESPFYYDSPYHADEVAVESEEDSIGEEFSNCENETSAPVQLDRSSGPRHSTGRSSYSPDSIIEEFSFSPDENSIGDTSQNTVLKIRVVELSPNKFGNSSLSTSPLSDY